MGKIFELRLRSFSAHGPEEKKKKSLCKSKTPEEKNPERRKSARHKPYNKELVPSGSQTTGRCHWRKELKKNGQKYTEYLAFDALRARVCRQETSEKLHKTGNEELLQQHRAEKARRMREYRAKKKQQKEEDEKKNGKKPKTRAEKEKGDVRKAKDAARKRKERKKMSKKKKKEINAKRREKRKQEREMLRLLELEEQKRLQNEKEKLEQELKRLAEEIEKAKLVTRSKTTRRQSLKRVKTVMPKNPVVYADTVEDLLAKASPRKKRLLEDRGITSTSNVDSIISKGIAERFNKLCKSRKKKDLKVKRNLASALAVSKKYKCQKHVCKLLKVTPKIFKSPVSQSHKRKIPGSTRDMVTKFYTQHSITLPDKKFVSKKTKQPARFLKQTISATYGKFKKAHPSVKVGLSSFAALRPKGVKKRSSIRYRGCLCEYCANVELKIQAVNQLCHQNNMPSAFSSVYDLNRITLCPRGEGNRYNKLACVKRTCGNCGVENIATHLKPILEKQGDNKLKWKKWERENHENGEKKGKKMVLKTNDGTLSELITQLQEEASTLALHLFNALWQGDQFNLISQDPPNGWVIMVLDFAENYSCRFQDEIQSVHWGHNSATIHPIVAYYKCPKCGEPTTNSMIMITHDNTHDHHAVHAFSQIAVDHLKEQIPDMTQIVRFSDGCPTQYKSRGPFMDVSYGKSDYGVNYQHEFFGSRHGKGPSDGESGVIKCQATDAVMSGNVVIANAKDLFVYVRDNCCTSSSNDECQHFQRSAFWIEHIDRDRGRQTSQTVKDTRSFHSVKSVRPNIIGTRKLSCFCQTCVSEKGTCHNQAFVEQYIYKDVQRGTSAVTPPEPESEPTMYAGVEPMEIEADNNDEEPRALNTSGVAVETMSRAVETTSKSAETTSGAVKASGATEITSGPNQAMVTPVKESLSNDMYVAVRFQSRPKNIIYLAMILNVDDKEVTLAFLKRDNSGYYDFTDEKHHIHPREDICGILNSPEMVQVRRSLVCRFKQSELDELAKKEIAILK